MRSQWLLTLSALKTSKPWVFRGHHFLNSLPRSPAQHPTSQPVSVWCCQAAAWSAVVGLQRYGQLVWQIPDHHSRSIFWTLLFPEIHHWWLSWILTRADKRWVEECLKSVPTTIYRYRFVGWFYRKLFWNKNKKEKQTTVCPLSQAQMLWLQVL